MPTMLIKDYMFHFWAGAKARESEIDETLETLEEVRRLAGAEGVSTLLGASMERLRRERIATEALRSRIDRAIDAIPRDDIREMLWDYYVEGMSMPAVAGKYYFGQTHGSFLLQECRAAVQVGVTLLEQESPCGHPIMSGGMCHVVRKPEEP